MTWQARAFPKRLSQLNLSKRTSIGAAGRSLPGHERTHAPLAMNLLRRQFLHLAAGAAALPALSRMSWAQTYPSRPVRLLIGFSAGGGADIVGRLIGQWLQERLGQPVV